MDPKLLYWTAALVLLATVVVLSILGVRHARRGEIARHRRAMKSAAMLIGLFLASYAVKLWALGAEDRSDWTLFDVWVLRIHETFVALMLLGGAVAGWHSLRLRTTRLATHDPDDPIPEPRVARRHRVAGRIAVLGAVLSCFFAIGILVGMYYRVLG